MKRQATAVVCVTACKATPGPAARPPTPAAAAPEPPASLDIQRAELDAFAEQIVQAAAHEDVEVLRALMDDAFISEPVGVTLDSDAFARTWAHYEEGLDGDPELRGRVAIRFTTGPTGEVTRSEVAESEVPDDVADCIAEVIAFWRFPKPQGDEDVVVTYPFVLEPR